MNRLLAVLTVALLAAPVAVADIPPPPPPKGKKYVSVNNEVVLGKDVSGYVFVQQVGSGPGAPRFTYEKLDLSADKAKPLAAGGRRTSVSLIAVPADAAKEFKTDAELFDALKANKVKGAVTLGFSSTATVPTEVRGDSVKWTSTVTAIDAKGIQTKVEGEGVEKPGDKPGKKDRPLAQFDVLVAGLAAFVGLTLGGFWLAGRARRKV